MAKTSARGSLSWGSVAGMENAGDRVLGAGRAPGAGDNWEQGAGSREGCGAPASAKNLAKAQGN